MHHAPCPCSLQQGYVEAGTKTTVSVTASAWDERSGSNGGEAGCGEDGCLPELAHDGVGEEDVESRWSCKKDIVPNGGQCEIVFTFGSPQDIVGMEVDFWKGDERKRTLKVRPEGWPGFATFVAEARASQPPPGTSALAFRGRSSWPPRAWRAA